MIKHMKSDRAIMLVRLGDFELVFKGLKTDDGHIGSPNSRKANTNCTAPNIRGMVRSWRDENMK
jgi:hypothetical protein